MKLLIASDLHFEFHHDKGRALVAELARTPCDAFVCAGDLADSKHVADALALLCDSFKCVIYTPGNHELYGSSWKTVSRLLHCAEQRHSNLMLLDNGYNETNGLRVFGGTLWWTPRDDDFMYTHMMNDFSQISDLREIVGRENSDFINQFSVAAGNTGIDLVVSHHLPSRRSTPKRFERSNLNRFFVCDVEALIRDESPALWVHGHTHDSCDYTIGETRVLCNPFGYADYETNQRFNHALIVEINP